MPLVVVMSSDLKPIRAREAISYSRRTRVVPSGAMFFILALRLPIDSITVPWKSVGMSMTRYSIGSIGPCGESLKMTSGRATPSS